ncbi:MAG: hypothetical protein JRI94_18425, partial [Deltaproteobacteria bacterium]|nr:hypothetical protein [Deltaproteobacteria bacterium]
RHCRESGAGTQEKNVDFSKKYDRIRNGNDCPYLLSYYDGIMRKDTTTAKLTKVEIERNKKISKKRYIVEQYFGLSHLHDCAYRARFTTILKNIWDTMCRQMAFNVFRGSKLLAVG